MLRSSYGRSSTCDGAILTTGARKLAGGRDENVRMSTRVSVPGELITWVRERSRVNRDELIRRNPQLPAWEVGTSAPTLRQLERHAASTRAPIGYFFLPLPPVEQLPLQGFRTVRDEAVMVNGVVGSDTHRKLDPNEFRGFALVDDLAPGLRQRGRLEGRAGVHAGARTRARVGRRIRRRQPVAERGRRAVGSGVMQPGRGGVARAGIRVACRMDGARARRVTSWRPSGHSSRLRTSTWSPAHAAGQLVAHEIASASPKRIKMPNAWSGVSVRSMTPYEMLRLARARFVLGRAS